MAVGDAARSEERSEVEERIEAKRLEVQKILVDWLGQIEVDRDGVFSFPVDSTRVFIRVTEFRDSTVISIEAPTNLDVPATPDVFRHVATHADEWLFGHLSCREEEGKVTITFSHRLLGDFLEPQELQGAVGAVAYTANQIDEALMQQFGGRLFAEVTGDPPPAGRPVLSPVADPAEGAAVQQIAAASGKASLRPEDGATEGTEGLPEAGYL